MQKYELVVICSKLSALPLRRKHQVRISKGKARSFRLFRVEFTYQSTWAL